MSASTLTEYLLVLVGNPPAELHCQKATLSLACRAMEPRRHPFMYAAEGLLTDLVYLKIKAEDWAEFFWNFEWKMDDTRLHNLILNVGNFFWEFNF